MTDRAARPRSDWAAQRGSITYLEHVRREMGRATGLTWASWIATPCVLALVAFTTREPHLGLTAFLLYAAFGVPAWRGVRLTLTSQMKERLEASSKDEVFPVDIQIRRAGLVTGIDQGLVTFDRNSLTFKGKECTFAITSDLTLKSKLSQESLASIWTFPISSQRVLLGDSGDQMILCMRTHDHVVNSDWNTRQKAFQDRLKAWTEATESAGVPAVLPPTGLHPEARHVVGDKYRLAGLGAGMGLVAAALALWPGSAQSLDPGERFFFVPVIGAIGLWIILRSLSQARDLKEKIGAFSAGSSAGTLLTEVV